jgi:hypothetical protein
MNLHQTYIEETGQQITYLKWVEKKLQTLLENQPNPNHEAEEVETNLMETTRGLIIEFFSENTKHNYETYINYDAGDLSYQTQIIFPRRLELSEKENVENIINYWSNIPYVSVEGNYGLEWGKSGNYSFVIISIDFTKSASDDYMLREILEKLADWVWRGTPVRKDNKRKYDGVVKPIIVRADCP